jgi:Raf kinase inhibitor-like YbhB/YbcL family protein
MTYRRSAIRATAAAFVSATAAVFAACGGGSSYTSAPAESSTRAAISTPLRSTLTLTSDAFANNGTIPTAYTCAGAGTSPALAWSGAPAATTEFVLIVHDPDAPLAGGFTHWIVVDLPAAASSLPAAVPAGDTIAGGGSQLVAYRGMCPPAGAAAHHYHFRLYALGSPVDLNPDPTKDSVEAAIQGHILAQTDLVGLFGR